MLCIMRKAASLICIVWNFLWLVSLANPKFVALHRVTHTCCRFRTDRRNFACQTPVVRPKSRIPVSQCQKTNTEVNQVKRTIVISTAGALLLVAGLATAESVPLKAVNKANEVILIPDIGEHLTAILATVPLQLLAYHVACLKGTDVDQPRNLAKSVTVE